MDNTTARAGEEDSAANWQSALEDNAGNFDQSELPWYGDGQSPSYSREPTPAQTEAARRFVSNWLEHDNQGFAIPGSEWGRSLKHWLSVLVARTAEDVETIEIADSNH